MSTSIPDHLGDGRYHYAAIITRVIDGDTVVADIDLGFGCWLKGQRIRLYCINAPELIGATSAAGRAAMERLTTLIQGRAVGLASIKDRSDKYGRYLAIIHLDGVDVNALMVTEGHAVEAHY